VDSCNPIWTIGHSNHTEDLFATLVRGEHIEMVIDVRSQPFSQYTPHFNRAPLNAWLAKDGVEYIFMGDELGGRPPEPFLYDREGHVDYRQLASHPRFLGGIERLARESNQARVAVMCSEEDPINCHRRLLIARVLKERAEILHIRGDGTVINEGQFSQEFDPPKMPTLWSEEEPWRSIRPVSPSSLPSNSLSH